MNNSNNIFNFLYKVSTFEIMSIVTLTTSKFLMISQAQIKFYLLLTDLVHWFLACSCFQHFSDKMKTSLNHYLISFNSNSNNCKFISWTTFILAFVVNVSNWAWQSNLWYLVNGQWCIFLVNNAMISCAKLTSVPQKSLPSAVSSNTVLRLVSFFAEQTLVLN